MNRKFTQYMYMQLTNRKIMDYALYAVHHVYSNTPERAQHLLEGGAYSSPHSPPISNIHINQSRKSQFRRVNKKD